MDTISSTTIIGRVVRDPELRFFDSGAAKLSFTAAVDKPGKKREDGNDKTDFYDVEVWNKGNRKLAEWNSEKIAAKTLVGVTGRFTSRKHDGKTYWTLEAETVQVLAGGKPKAGASGGDDFGF